MKHLYECTECGFRWSSEDVVFFNGSNTCPKCSAYIAKENGFYEERAKQEVQPLYEVEA